MHSASGLNIHILVNAACLARNFSGFNSIITISNSIITISTITISNSIKTIITITISNSIITITVVLEGRQKHSLDRSGHKM